MIEAIDSVLMFVNNLKVQIEFYQNILGLEILHTNPSMAQFKFKGTSTTFILHKRSQGHPAEIEQNMGKIHFNFQVQDLKSFLTQLRDQNVKIIKDIHNPGFGYKVATIEDLEGNQLDLLEKIEKP